MILTIALNPGIQKRIGVEALTEGSSIPVKSYDLRLEGSGIQAAYMMRLLQAEAYVLGFTGGIGGRYIKNFLDKNRIKSNLIGGDKELKTTFLIESDNGTVTTLIDGDKAFDEKDARNFKHKLVTQIDEAELAVVSGHVGQEGSRVIFTEAIEQVKKAHKRLVLALDGDDIEAFIAMSPFALLLDEGQVAELTGGFKDLEACFEQLREIAVTNHIHYIFFQRGDEVIGITRKKISYGKIAGAVPRPLTWQKHAMLGGLAIGIKRQYEFEKILKVMTGVSHAISEEQYPVLCTRKDVDVQIKKVKIEDYYRGGTYRFADKHHGV